MNYKKNNWYIWEDDISAKMWLDLRKPGFHAQLQIFRKTEFNYLKYYNSGREADACMKFATIL